MPEPFPGCSFLQIWRFLGMGRLLLLSFSGSCFSMLQSFSDHVCRKMVKATGGDAAMVAGALHVRSWSFFASGWNLMFRSGSSFTMRWLLLSFFGGHFSVLFQIWNFFGVRRWLGDCGGGCWRSRWLSGVFHLTRKSYFIRRMRLWVFPAYVGWLMALPPVLPSDVVSLRLFLGFGGETVGFLLLLLVLMFVSRVVWTLWV